MKKEINRNCPFCEAEVFGCSSGWGMSPEAWQEKEKEHCRHKIKELEDEIRIWKDKLFNLGK